MKVRCIDNDKQLRDIPITEGKVYSVLGEINGCYMVINDNGEDGCYLKCRFEEVEEVEKEKVLEIEFQEVFDKIVWRITYQNEEILDRCFKDYDLKVMAEDAPEYYDDILWLRGYNKRYDNRVNLSTKEEAEIIKQKVDAINEKYGIPKKWRANIGGRYFYITAQGRITHDFERNTKEDDLRYHYGNYFRTEDECMVKLEKIRLVFKGG